MQDSKKKPEYEIVFASCVYSGISKEIDWEMEHGMTDRTEELQYCVDRYCDEFIVSGQYLQEKLDEYKQAVKTRI